MCGIAAIFHLDGEIASPIILRRMITAISHRGPDGEGVYSDGCFSVGHRRLAILDLSPAGHQPMMTEDGRYVLSFNGEIYNFRELRQELEALGLRFRSQTDSEVVLKSLATWGSAALLRFNGMFAFVLWDRVEKELLFARDRYGIKPLYFCHQNDTLLIGSEVKAILAHPNYTCRMDWEGLLEYLTFQNFLTSRTLFRNIQLLPPATFMRIRQGISFLPSPEIYWDFHFSESEKGESEETYIEELQRLFYQAVTRQLVSDVEVGAFLSGGMDSGSITSIAAGQMANFKSFTVGFDLSSASGLEMAFDERRQAEHMSYRFNTEHYQMVLKAGDMERAMPKLTWHLEEPRVGQSYPNYYAAKLASKFVKVVLAGAGGDEIFGGYPWRYYRSLGCTDFEHFIDEYYQFWQRLIPNSVIKQLLNPIWHEVQHVWTRDIFRDVFLNHANELKTPEDYINHSLYFEAKTFLHGLLVVEDKVGMAHSLETRVPFLDNDLVDFAMRLPVSLKLSNLHQVIRINENEVGKQEKHFQRTGDGKAIFRKAMTKFIPKSVTEAIKQGFSAPDAAWFKGESIQYVKRKLLNGDARLFAFMDKETVQSLVEEHLSGAQNRRLLIWSLLNLEQWCHHFL